MSFAKAQYIIFALITILSILVVLLLIRDKKRNEDILFEPQVDKVASLPPVGENFEEVAKIEIESGNILDLGLIPNDRETTKKVKVFNKGKGPLNLRFIHTSCACTQGTIPPGQEVIPPGGEGHIIVTVFPSKVAGFYSEKTLSIYSNDPKNSPLELKVIARVDPEFLIEPENIDFGEIDKGTSKEISVTITQKNMKKPLEIYKVYEPGVPASIQNNIGCSIKKLEEKETIQYLLTFKVEPFITPGEFNRLFLISTNIDRYPEVPIKIRGKVNAPYKLNIAFPTPVALNPLIKKTSEQFIIESLEENEPVILTSYEIEPNIFSASPNITGEKIIFNIQSKDASDETYGILIINLKSKEHTYEERVLLKNIGKLKLQ